MHKNEEHGQISKAQPKGYEDGSPKKASTSRTRGLVRDRVDSTATGFSPLPEQQQQPKGKPLGQVSGRSFASIFPFSNHTRLHQKYLLSVSKSGTKLYSTKAYAKIYIQKS